MSSSNCCFLTCIQVSQEAAKVVWYSHLFKNFPQFFCDPHSQRLWCSQWSEVDVFWEFSCFFYNPMDHRKSKRVPEKHLLLLYWLHQSFWLCGSQQTGKFLKRWEYQTTWPASWEICVQVRKQQLELDIEQQTGSKLGKEYVKSVYCHPAYLTYMWNTSCEMLGWMTHKIARRNISNLR